jgi:hypothetical protein
MKTHATRHINYAYNNCVGNQIEIKQLEITLVYVVYS